MSDSIEDAVGPEQHPEPELEQLLVAALEEIAEVTLTPRVPRDVAYSALLEYHDRKKDKTK